MRLGRRGSDQATGPDRPPLLDPTGVSVNDLPLQLVPLRFIFGPMSPRKRTARCPHCREMFSPQGLLGHLRFKHQAPVASATAKAVTRVTGVRDRSQWTLELIKELEALGSERKELEAERAKQRDPDGTLADCIDALKDRELEVRNELRRQQGRAPLTRFVEQPLFGRKRDVFREVVDEEGNPADEDDAADDDDEPVPVEVDPETRRLADELEVELSSEVPRRRRRPARGKPGA